MMTLFGLALIALHGITLAMVLMTIWEPTDHNIKVSLTLAVLSLAAYKIVLVALTPLRDNKDDES